VWSRGSFSPRFAASPSHVTGGSGPRREIADLGRTYQGVSRCVRQSLALHAKLKRDRLAAEKADPPPKPKTD
jgi:hypothetical protein